MQRTKEASKFWSSSFVRRRGRCRFEQGARRRFHVPRMEGRKRTATCSTPAFFFLCSASAAAGTFAVDLSSAPQDEATSCFQPWLCRKRRVDLRCSAASLLLQSQQGLVDEPGATPNGSGTKWNLVSPLLGEMATRGVGILRDEFANNGNRPSPSSRLRVIWGT